MQRRFRKAALWGATVAAVMAAAARSARRTPRRGPTRRPSLAPRHARRDAPGPRTDAASRLRIRLAQETDAHRAAAAVRRALSAPPAGMWFDKTTGKLVVAVTGAADAQRVRAAGAVPRTVPHSHAALTALVRQITGRAGKGVPGVTGWGVDERANGVVVRVDRTRRTARDRRLREGRPRLSGRRAKIPVTVERTDQTPRQQGGTVVGGERWMPGNEGICSIGFSVTGPRGLQGFCDGRSLHPHRRSGRVRQGRQPDGDLQPGRQAQRQRP